MQFMKFSGKDWRRTKISVLLDMFPCTGVIRGYVSIDRENGSYVSAHERHQSYCLETCGVRGTAI